jgi:purine-cytosine permease-like protein
VGFALVALALAVVGYDKIHLAQRGFAYLMIVILTVFSVGALFVLRLPAVQWQLGGFRAVPFLAQLFSAASYQLSWSIYVSDYSRYLPRDVGVRESFWWTYLGAFIGGAWMMLVGTVAAAAAPRLDVAAAMEHAADAVMPGLGKVLLLAALLGLITISSLNFYGASLTLLSVADTLKPLRCTVGKRIASLLVAFAASCVISVSSSSDFVNRFADLLALLLYLFTPWTAINLVDFYLVRRGHYSIREIFNPAGMYGRWNWRGLSAYLIGFIVMIPFFSTTLYTGPVARALGGADIAMLVGLPVAAGVYLLACRSIDLEHEWQRARVADVGLEPADIGLEPHEAADAQPV